MNIKIGFMQKYLIGLVLVIFTAFGNANTMDLRQAAISFLDTKAFQVAKTIGIGLGATAVSILSHECGHAFMAKIVNGSPLNVNIGGYWDQPIKAKIGPFILRGWNPFIGYADTGNLPSKWHRILTLLAGPCTGAAAALMLSKLNSNFKYKAICLCLIHYNINNLIPYSIAVSDEEKTYTDGALILNEFIDQRNTDTITSITSNKVVKILLTISGFCLLEKTIGKYVLGK